MGRQAYLAKIAFGRSAFEPTQSATQSTEYVQLESSHSELPRPYQEATVNNYIQLYDERGNPINPRSHGYGKQLRDAQNDVLASVGVVERRRSPDQGLAGSYEDRLELLEAEDTVGNALALTSTLTENFCTWWIGTIRERILTFRYQDAVPFFHIVALEQAVSGASILYTGFASRLISTMSIQAIVYSAFVHQPIERLLYMLRARPRTRYFFRRSKNALKFGLRLGLEVLFYPFSYHARLQRLGLVPANPLLPSWKTLNPFSPCSPLTPFSLHYSTSGSVRDCMKAALTSPLILVCAEHFIERWVYACIYEAVESSIIRPDNADMQSRDLGDKERTTTILGLRRQSPPLIRAMINKLLTTLGWGRPLTPVQADRQHSTESGQRLDPTDRHTIDVGGTQVTNVTPLELPVVQTHDQLATEASGAEVITIPIDAIDEMIRPTTPPTPTMSALDQDDNDPRIRITSREGIVEMEVRLPPRILSTHTEVADVPVSSTGHRANASRNGAYMSGNGPYHRVTQLSSEPAQMISAIVKAQLVGLAILPLKLVTLRMVASHYLSSQGGQESSWVVRPLFDLNDFNWRTMGVQLSRVALCSALELSIDIGLWGLQYFAVTKIGKNVFGWGTL